MAFDNPPAYSGPVSGFPSFEKSASSTFSNPTTTPQAHDICAIALSDTDKIRLINTPESLTRLVRATIAATWGPIQAERAEFDNAGGGANNTSHPPSSCSCSSSSYSSSSTPTTITTPFFSYEFKLKGNPWTGWGEEKVRCRRLVVGLLKCMIKQGYSLIRTSKVIRRVGERDVFFFESSSSSSLGNTSKDKDEKKAEGQEEDEDRKEDEEEEEDIFSITFNKNNTVRIIDAPPAVAVHVQQAILRYWPTGIKSQQFYHGAEEFVMNPVRISEPLTSYGCEAMRWSMVLVEILSSLRNHLGYKLYTSVDMNTTPGPGMIDTWILRKMSPSWP
ncbi:hypothetical protein CPC16_003227 [Podila verticillata]|nr:hypothetical protein BGZ59_006677 [Podila verticillata]KAF9392510.1 hypothetical protein CPC16_003227 [Podila verticillata]KFH67100.1 hypothetical protein MVEG_07623 [Podila verticillata NRRL 6337]